MADKPPPVDYAQTDPDVRLMLQVQQNDDEAAFAKLVTRYRPGVYVQFRLAVGKDEAEDLTQETFMRVYLNRKTYRAEAKFATWLFSIARNVGRNALRTKRRRPVVPLEGASGEQHASRLADHRGETPSRQLQRSEMKKVVKDALQNLHRRQRTALVHQHYDDLSYEQIAQELALSPKAAKSLLYRARAQLRQELEPRVTDSVVRKAKPK